MTDVAVADAIEIDLDDRRRGPLRVLFSARSQRVVTATIGEEA